MRIRGEEWRVSWALVVAVLFLPTVFVVRQLHAQARGGKPAPYVTPAPRASLDSMSDSALASYIASLRFDLDPWAGDEQRLLLGRFDAKSPELARYGPLAAIQPEEGIGRLRQSQLERGRIVARFINRDSTPYPKLALAAHGVTYWWIEGRYQQGSERGGRAVFIATDSVGGRIHIIRRTRASLYYDPHPEQYEARYRPNPRASARWYWTDRDELGWVPCPDGCCRSGAE